MSVSATLEYVNNVIEEPRLNKNVDELKNKRQKQETRRHIELLQAMHAIRCTNSEVIPLPDTWYDAHGKRLHIQD